MCQTYEFLVFIGLSGLCGLWIFCESLGKMFLMQSQISPEAAVSIHRFSSYFTQAAEMQ